MKLFKNILRLCATAVAVLPLFGCGEDEYVKPSALLAESSLTFDAVGAEPQTLTIASDEAWFVDVDSDWITVDPASGSNTVDVTVSVSDNVTNGAMNAPREGTLTIANNRGYSVRTVIYQKGDTYLGVDEYDIAGLAALEDGTRAKVKETQVVALTSDGFIAADASGAMYFLGNAGNVKIGDKVTMNGSSSTTNTVKTFTSDEVTIVSEASVSYPEAKDITSTVGSYKPEAIEYVKVSGTLINKGLRVGSQTNAVTLYNPGIDIESVNLHKVVAYGYALLYAKTLYFVPTSFEDGGLDEDLTFYPVKYQIRKTPINFSTASFSAEGKIDPVEGLGYIQYVPFDLDNTNDNNKFALDVSDNSPRVIGPWPGDYWLFYCYGAVKAGSVMHITFEARTSATGHKYWMIEYLDGDVWKPAADKLKATDVPGGCEYTHAMNADGATNVKVDAEVKLKKNMDNCQFRFRCMANWQASGAGALATRNGGSGRLSVTDKDSDECQPKIFMVKEGDGVEIPDTDPIEANIVVSKDLLTFEGTPDAPKKLTVTSDYDFTIESSEKWLTLSATSGSANEELELSVTCEPSALSTLREATITIKSEESRKVINVVQSAAGGELEPFISIVGGNSINVKGNVTEKIVSVQSNVAYQVEVTEGADWLSAETVATKALVEVSDLRLTMTENKLSDNRVAKVRVYNSSENLESYLTVTQTPSVITLAKWFLDGTTMDGYKDTFGGVDGVSQNDKNPGDGGQYLDANNGGNGRLTYVQIDKRELDVNNKAYRVTGGTGEPFVTGCWPGDYWLFTAHYEQGIPVGAKIHGFFVSRASGTGMKYFLAEYLDGTEWKPVLPTSTVKVGDEDVTFNINHNNTANFPVDFTYTVGKATKDMQIRVKCVTNAQASGKGPLSAPNGGTVRLKGGDLSPYFEMTL